MNLNVIQRSFCDWNNRHADGNADWDKLMKMRMYVLASLGVKIRHA
jgi:hypothetical protein